MSSFRDLVGLVRDRVGPPPPPAPTPAPNGGVEPPAPAGPPASEEVTRRLMALRDDALAAAEEVGGGGARALATVARKVEEILRLDQVEPIDDVGPYDPARHHIVDCVGTDDHRLDDQIASGVRSGYRRADVLLRRQDVLVYRLADGTGGAG